MSDRGEYRAIRTVLIDGPDYQQLTPAARFVFLTLKLNLGPFGFGVLYAAVLAEQTGYELPLVRDALNELEEGGWIRRDRNVMWVVDGLRHEPSISAVNRLHRISLQRSTAALPRLPIVDAFRAYYPEWFVEGIEAHEPQPLPSIDGDSYTHPIPTAMGMAYPLEARKTEDGVLKTEDKHPSSSSARARFLEPLTPEQRTIWERTLAGYEQGLGLARGQAATPDDVNLALDDYNLLPPEQRTYSPPHVRGFVNRRLRERLAGDEPQKNGRPPPAHNREPRTIGERMMAKAKAAGMLDEDPPLQP